MIHKDEALQVATQEIEELKKKLEDYTKLLDLLYKLGIGEIEYYIDKSRIDNDFKEYTYVTFEIEGTIHVLTFYNSEFLYRYENDAICRGDMDINI